MQLAIVSYLNRSTPVETLLLGPYYWRYDPNALNYKRSKYWLVLEHLIILDFVLKWLAMWFATTSHLLEGTIRLWPRCLCLLFILTFRWETRKCGHHFQRLDLNFNCADWIFKIAISMTHQSVTNGKLFVKYLWMLSVVTDQKCWRNRRFIWCYILLSACNNLVQLQPLIVKGMHD